MSLVAASNVAFQRRSDNTSQNPSNLNELEEAVGAPPPSTNAVTSALSAIATYIPSEILTLYIAVLAALQAPPVRADNGLYQTAWIALGMFAIATPLVVWILYATRVVNANKPLPAKPSLWPVWEMSSAAIAFVAWTFALPNTPFASQKWYSAPLAGIIVLIVSTALGLLAPLFTRRPLTSS